MTAITKCFGRNPRTGKRVGSRHRWDFGICRFCARFKDEVYKKPSAAEKEGE